MKKFLITFALLVSMFVPAMAQDGDASRPTDNQTKVVRKIKIRHADPQLIALILAGKVKFTTPPEITTVEKIKG